MLPLKNPASTREGTNRIIDHVRSYRAPSAMKVSALLCNHTHSSMHDSCDRLSDYSFIALLHHFTLATGSTPFKYPPPLKPRLLYHAVDQLLRRRLHVHYHKIRPLANFQAPRHALHKARICQPVRRARDGLRDRQRELRIHYRL
ncbi:hypothetical protein LEL_10859 [Akanthomyces lecanii RCEF 1005]|uniref:Uncharacterized protein n=1 Tax=Akanthomyces lecanii RCEF 1005 TaxID=1081108 RepID=A0A167S4W4_CORDF|nr:hypothetical protein LEL_10859 [Akanthomyces lecanii RCEF 1005]